MFEKFFSIDSEKQERIIGAAVKEFALKGYEKASTNVIVKEAGIAKGLLFHYFNNKKDLYLFLYDRFSDILIAEFYGKIDWEETDLLRKLRQVTLLKFELMKKHPALFDFLRVAYEEKAADIRPSLEERNQGMTAEAYGCLFEHIDPSLFKEGIDMMAAVNMTVWTMEGLGQTLQVKMKDVSVEEIDQAAVLKEMDVYLELLRFAMYKA
ncbi:TetR/AcrR family transcriptional regulator [Mesobacillus zeae]|uniref:TetR/AcrR family transcriptional regulator n=1 Tax=Mesobacillus zeae TaxID=1917180 RepID=A0A398BGM5_9BACI|nr:TetR/AcrR family transcriptional regulator [Mesobacillus zeae]RID86780.1 TetR/AcrR family transcriptional regulator [Mesobacillus zeae]